MKKQINLRISKLTEKQLAELEEITGTKTGLILLAVDRLHRDVFKNKDEKEKKEDDSE